MYWSSTHGIIEGAEMDGGNRSTIALLRDSRNNTYDAQGLALDIPMNRIYFVSKTLYSLLYIDLDSAGSGSVQTLFSNQNRCKEPRDVALDDQFVYWNEYWTEKVYRINKTAWDGRVEVVVSGLFSPRGMAIKKGNPSRDSECSITIKVIIIKSTTLLSFTQNMFWKKHCLSPVTEYVWLNVSALLAVKVIAIITNYLMSVPFQTWHNARYKTTAILEGFRYQVSVPSF